MCKFWRSEMCKSSHCNLNITIFIISTWVDLGESRSWPPPPSKDPLWKFEVLKIYLAKLPNISNLLPLHKHSDIPRTFPRKIFRDTRMFIFCLCFFLTVMLSDWMSPLFDKLVSISDVIVLFIRKINCMINSYFYF